MPDLECYTMALAERIGAAVLRGIRLASPFVLRSVALSIDDVIGQAVAGVHRVGKRLVIGLSTDDPTIKRHIVFHLMIAGRLRWYDARKKIPARYGLMAFNFDVGTLGLTEAVKKHRAAVHLIEVEDNLQPLHLGGRDPGELSLSEFVADPDPGKSYDQAQSQGSAFPWWDRQRLLRRDPPPCTHQPDASGEVPQ
ncbi:MAG: hypothetical protein CMQ05_12825 [Gammaproteobacteria bacterium]|nr:hypothetical protein [Gammaproteobacteria bacterium]